MPRQTIVIDVLTDSCVSTWDQKMRARMKSLLAALICLALFASQGSANLIITGIVDPDVDFNARAIEVYVDGSVDFSNITLYRAANSAPFDETFSTFTGTYTDTFVYFVNDAAAFASVFGISGSNVIESGAIQGTGNDGFRFADTGGDIDTVGEGGNNIYQDSYMYRASNTGPDGSSFVSANWSIPGNNTLDGLTAAETSAAVPFGTYTISAVPEASSFLFGGLSLAIAGVGYARRRRS